jgi:tRNA (mo5U34)-methyltransferase
MNDAELRSRIAAFDTWHYRFEFEGGIHTPIRNETRVNRHEQRSRHFFDALLRALGGSLRGHRVLDLGCNAGFWSLKAADRGADFVLGVDGRQMHVDQANLVFEAKGIDPSRYRFEVANIFEYHAEAEYDVVLCLGLMYHISKPVELFELMNRAGADVIVIDTRVSTAAGSLFEVDHEALDDPRDAVDYELVLVPTAQAVVDLGAQFGFRTVPLHVKTMTGVGVNDYLEGRRVAFIGVRTTALNQLPGVAAFLDEQSVAAHTDLSRAATNHTEGGTQDSARSSGSRLGRALRFGARSN